VHRPPSRCNTYWNYTCGSEVIIRIYDPRVPWCSDAPTLPGKQVAITSIGYGVSPTEIQREAAGTSEGLTTTGEPFGGSLEPAVFFGEGLLTSGITHYRWSYRLKGVGDWTVLDRQVVRHYGEIQADGKLIFKAFQLGPDPGIPGMTLFKIWTPQTPPYNWIPLDQRENSASAFFLSHLLKGGNAAAAAGKYELKLELFKYDGTNVTPVNLSDENVLLKVPTIAAPFGPVEVETREVPHDPDPLYAADDMEERVIRDGAGKIVAFRLVLHVDNTPCEAEIYDTAVGIATAGPCGFISYDNGTDLARISFRAHHDHNFARFKFGVVKGSSGYCGAACAPVDPGVDWPAAPLVGTGPVNGFLWDPGNIYSKNVTISDLVGACPEGNAAFGEYLYVEALATDGWTRLDHLDASAVPKAFALLKQKTPSP
jgi:hypothetical protein